VATITEREPVITVRRARLPAEAIAGYLFVAPAAILTLIFVVWPIVQSFQLSFYEWNGDGPRTFVGLDNYVKLTQDSAYVDAFQHNFIFVIGYTVFEVFFGFLLAALLNTRVRGVVIFRTLFFLPVVVPTAISALLWSLVLSPSVDPFGAVLRAVGLPFLARPWLGDSDIALYTVTAIAVWKNVGIAMIVYLAAMQDIPTDLLEAAAIDGAGPARRLFSIVLPLLKPITAVLIALSVIYSMRTFDIVWAITGSLPRPALEMVSTLIVRTAFSFHAFGLASALAVVLFLVIFALAAAQISTMERE
jgi:ABC-type sugar transport system permease subunit